MDPSLERDIVRLNLEFLRLVREAARRDLARACAIFGVPEETASLVAACDVPRLERLAACALPVFCLAPRSPALWKAVAEGRSEAPALACAWQAPEGH